MCDNCDQLDTEIDIRSPEQLKSLVNKIRTDLKDNIIIYNSFESDRALIGQVSFDQLNLENSIPDVMCYYFDCKECGNVFGLVCESYHSSGGKWSKLGNVKRLIKK
jgi:hypothetical protein